MNVHRNSYIATLLILQQAGISVKTILDIGAAEGGFFLSLLNCNLFSQAKHFFVDAMQENEEIYKQISHNFDADYMITALSCLEGSTQLSLDPNYYNTHIAGLQIGAKYQNKRTVMLKKLDSLIREKNLNGPYLIKLDVQGGELDVLRGAIKALESALVVVSEIQVFFERDTVVDLVGFMHLNGFLLFDITDQAYYNTSPVMYQCYMTFISKKIDFRKDLSWCSPEQEQEMLSNLKCRREHITQQISELCSKQNEKALVL